ncbi:MAG: hypothetical protein ACXWHI_04100 [Candidatus Aminicenantales bacterium]
MADQFRDAEATFSLLREKFKAKKISPQEFATSLKQLRIKDEEGRFWVIGAQSGKWYAFENGEWFEAKPPSQMEKKAICIACGFENDLEAESCARCGNTGAESAPEALAEADGAGPAAAVEAALLLAGPEVTVRSVDIVSFLWFFGVLGLFAGILFGLLAGAVGLFAGFVAHLPAFFVDHQGDLLGGLAFSVVGGILGFAIGAGAGAVAAVVSNGILSLIGGVRLRRS